MPMIDIHQTVGALVAERPARSRVLEQFGIDYCCGGKKSLHEACAESGHDIGEVLYALGQSDATPQENATDWTTASLTDLIKHIVETHHAYLATELPRLDTLTQKVARVHGENHPELADVAEVYAQLYSELDSHMMKEERILFPMIQELEKATRRPAFHCGSVGNPIRTMEYEHDGAGKALDALRKLTGDYTPPQDACNTYRAMLDALAHLEDDLHQHIHKENNILFPRAVALEASL